jgi:hypothetical protein
VGRHPRDLLRRALEDVPLGAVVKDQQLRQPAGILVGDVRLQQPPQDRLVDAHKIIADIQLQVPGPALAVGRRLADEPLQPIHCGEHALALAAGVGVVDEGPFPVLLQVAHQHVVDPAVGEVRGEDLPELRSP